jgi:hypothetical protein
LLFGVNIAQQSFVKKVLPTHHGGKMTSMAKCRGFIAHAFKVSDGRERLTPEDHLLLEKIAGFIVSREMSTPAILFLESVKPLNFIGSSILRFFQPLVGWALSKFEYERFAELLSHRCSVPFLIEKIEHLESNKKDRSITANRGQEK